MTPSDLIDRERLIRLKVTELVAAGGSVTREQTYGGEFGHVVMADPEGNGFCVA